MAWRSPQILDYTLRANHLTLYLLILVALTPLYLTALAVYGANATTLNVGYAPAQPVPFSHALHNGKLGIDCTYCHTTTTSSPFAALPPAQTCMNCHRLILPNANPLLPIRESYSTGMPVPWAKVHDLPQYVYFNHAAHTNAGVGCIECHGQVSHMDQIAQVQNLSMAWCLACHRHPEDHLRSPDQVTNMDFIPPPNQHQLGLQLAKQYHINPSTDCITCHR